MRPAQPRGRSLRRCRERPQGSSSNSSRLFFRTSPFCTSDRHATLPSFFVASPVSANRESAAELPIELVIHITEPSGGPGRTYGTVYRIRHSFRLPLSTLGASLDHARVTAERARIVHMVREERDILEHAVSVVSELAANARAIRVHLLIAGSHKNMATTGARDRARLV